MVQAARLGLARVSVVRGGSPRSEKDDGSLLTSSAPSNESHLVPVIDDYIRAVEPVHDYLTRFSGLVPGDLDPALSKHHIVELKHAYLKLRYLVDAGCVFVGHGLKQDFKMINVTVPPAQIVDTVELFHFKRQRKLSLRFLASYLLKEDIQQETHDSIEDARTAVRLYRKYLEMRAAGNFEGQLLEIYRFGKQHGFTGEKRPDNVDAANDNSGDTTTTTTTHGAHNPRRASESPRRWATTAPSTGGGDGRPSTASSENGKEGSEGSSRTPAGCPIGPPRRWNGSLVPTPHAGSDADPRRHGGPGPVALHAPKRRRNGNGNGNERRYPRADTAPRGNDADDAAVKRAAADAPGGSAAAAADADALRGRASAAASAARGATAEARAAPEAATAATVTRVLRLRTAADFDHETKCGVRV